MGGHRAGDVASRIAVEIIGDYWESVYDSLVAGRPSATGTPRLDAMEEAVKAANDHILSLSRANAEFQGMGSTVIALHIDDDGLHAIHIGDSRLYRFRQGQMTQISEDHTHAQESVRLGLIDAASAKGSYGWNLLLRALGVDATVEADRIEMAVQAGDVYLLCSDGLSDNVADAQMGTILSLRSSDLVEAVDNLIDSANANGGSDNISVVLARVDGS
jgi:protein phosphatase